MIKPLAIAVSAALTLSGCATIVNGSHQEIGINSTPVGARCQVDGKQFETPVIMPLKRRHNHIVRCSAPGYQDGTATITRSASPWIWGNMVYLTFFEIGMVIDYISGGWWKLTPANVELSMAPQLPASNAKQ